MSERGRRWKGGLHSGFFAKPVKSAVGRLPSRRPTPANCCSAVGLRTIPAGGTQIDYGASCAFFGPTPLVALDCAVDTSTPTREAMANMLATFAQFERRLISQRTREALAIKRASGVRLGRPPRSPRRSSGASTASANAATRYATIAESLNKDNVPTAQGGARGTRQRSEASSPARPDLPATQGTTGGPSPARGHSHWGLLSSEPTARPTPTTRPRQSTARQPSVPLPA